MGKLVQQGFLFGDRVYDARIDTIKYLRTRDRIKCVQLLGETYIYSFFKAVFSGMHWPNVQFGDNDLVLIGHFNLLRMMNSRSMTGFGDIQGDIVTRKIEMSKLDDNNFDAVYKSFSFLKGSRKNEDTFRFYHGKYERILELLKEFAVKEKSPYGLTFQLRRITRDLSPQYKDAEDFPLGNCALALDNQNVLLLPISSDVNLQDTDVILNSGLFVTLHTEKHFTKGVSLDTSIYRRYDISEAKHLIPLEVEAVTGMAVSPYIDLDEFEQIYNLILPNMPLSGEPFENRPLGDDDPKSGDSGDLDPKSDDSDKGGDSSKDKTP